jgi:dCTP deaminase
MSVKSDKWITKMSREHKMIEPFEGRQMRDGVISYGVSSYGYDLRVADEFCIFTNVNSTIVDPKHFDAKSFVEFKGDVCIVPPNSFALAPWNISASHATCSRSASANPPTRAAELSST